MIDEQKKAGTVSSVGVYFRDLNNGPWFGIDEKVPFAASSLLKVAHMMAVYKAAEYDPSLLERKVLYSKLYHTESQTIESDQKIVLGEEYTVDELVSRMIAYSDNEAVYLLQDQVPESLTDNIYADLSIEFTAENEISIRSYSTFFRVLYNASYLTEEYSEKALKLLTQTTFDQGLRAGVPASVPLAHKFGERALENPYNQMHDCGIVYYPDHSYLLCVMTRGQSIDGLTSTISHISRVVYDQVHQHYSGDE